MYVRRVFLVRWRRRRRRRIVVGITSARDTVLSGGRDDHGPRVTVAVRAVFYRYIRHRRLLRATCVCLTAARLTPVAVDRFSSVRRTSGYYYQPSLLLSVSRATSGSARWKRCAPEVRPIWPSTSKWTIRATTASRSRKPAKNSRKGKTYYTYATYNTTLYDLHVVSVLLLYSEYYISCTVTRQISVRTMRKCPCKNISCTYICIPCWSLMTVVNIIMTTRGNFVILVGWWWDLLVMIMFARNLYA